MRESISRTPRDAGSFRVPSAEQDRPAGLRRLKPGTPHVSEFTDPPMDDRLRMLRGDIPRLFAPEDPATMVDVMDAYGVSAEDVATAARAYVTETIAGADNPQAAWKGLLKPYYKKVKDGIQASNPQDVATTRANPVLQAIVAARSDAGVTAPFTFEQPTGDSTASGDDRINNSALIATLWNGTPLDALVEITGIKRVSVVQAAVVLRAEGFELEKRRQDRILVSPDMVDTIVQNWDKPNEEIFKLLGLSKRRGERLLARVKEQIALPDKSGGMGAMQKRRIRRQPDRSAAELAAELGISTEDVEAIRAQTSKGREIQGPEVDTILALYARGFQGTEIAIILEMSLTRLEYIRDHIPYETRKRHGISPGRKPVVDWRPQRAVLEDLGIDADAALARLEAHQKGKGKNSGPGTWNIDDTPDDARTDVLTAEDVFVGGSSDVSRGGVVFERTTLDDSDSREDRSGPELDEL